MSLYIPKKYRATLMPEMMEQAIKQIKDSFQTMLAEELDLRRVTAPLFVRSGTGINDDLNGTERAVRFAVPALGGADVEIVHSLAKWKRIQLGAYGIPAGFGLYTDMNAVRADEELDNIHSIYVDQWDWERTIRAEDRNLEFLKGIVRRIYSVIRSQERRVYETYRHITPVLPEEIVFVQSEELLREFPHRTPAERETEAARRYGAIFVIGIGGRLSDGKKHDGRAPDYDDWTTPTPGGYCGLNGDIVVWNPVLERAYEISSMGILVDREALLRQLDLEGCPERAGLEFHRALLEERIPLSVGGGIGQSRLCMFLLRCAHIGEVQASLWPDQMKTECMKYGIFLK